MRKMPPGPIQVPAADTPRPMELFALSVAVVIVAALFFAREILIPLILSVFLAFLLAPLVDFMRRHHVPRVVAVLLAMVLAVVVILLLAALIGSQVALLAQDLPQYQSTVIHKFEAVKGAVTGLIDSVTSHFGADAVPANAPGGSHRAPVAQPAPQPNQSGLPTASIEMGRRLLEPVFSPLGDLVVVFIVTTFILAQQEDVRDRLIRLFGSKDLHRTTRAIDEAAERLQRYFLTQAAVNSCFGVVISGGLLLIGVPNPILWGVLAMLLRFVPYVGPITAAVLPMALATAVDPNWTMVLWTGALFLVTEGLTGQVLEPLLYGHSTGLSPVAVVLAAIFWSWIWGPIGLILSTPITLCLVVVGRHVPHLEFFDVLLGDRPALTPVETFYQRLLAGDPDEITEQAELLLKGRALSSYYDEIAVRALQLAADDMARGVISLPRAERIRDDVAELIEDLEPYADIDPDLEAAKAEDEALEVAGAETPEHKTKNLPAPARQGDLPGERKLEPGVLCVAGRGVLDEAAAAMLGQLLRKHGFGVRLVPYEGVSRSGIGTLDGAGVAMICVSCLEPRGSPSHLRYLVRRLRQRLPDLPIVVGLWAGPEEEPQGLSGSRYVTSLRDAVNACLEQARGQ